MLISNNWKTVHVSFALCQGKGLSARKVSVAEKVMQNQNIYLAQKLGVEL